MDNNVDRHTTMSHFLHEAVNFSVWNPLERLFPPIGVDPQLYQGRVRGNRDENNLNRVFPQPDLASRLDAIIVLLFVWVMVLVTRGRP